MRAWLWVLLCTLGIYSTIPLARSFQKLVYKSVGKEFFTYLVFFVIAAGLITLLYLFIFKFKIKSVSQYACLIFCAGLYIYFTVQLSDSPEEAIHIIEYGLLAFFVFKALSHKIKDWTIYITAAFIIMLLGTVDEFIQWMMPARYWDYRDVGINFLAGAIFLFAIWKGIRPANISSRVKNHSIRVLVGVITLNLIFMGLCLSNSPDNIKRYTSAIGYLSWLQREEPMTEFGHRNYDHQIGYIYSRLRLEDLSQIDSENGKSYGKLIYDDNNAGLSGKAMIEKYGPDSNPFIYEFLLHHFRTAFYIKKFYDSSDLHDKSEFARIVLNESLIIKKYFATTFQNSGLKWLKFDRDNLKAAVLQDNDSYISRTGILITGLDINTARAAILFILFIVWIGGKIWKRKVSGD